MGSIQSYLGTETVTTVAAVIVSGVILGYVLFIQTPASPPQDITPNQSIPVGGKKKKAAAERDHAPGPSSSKDSTSAHPTVVKFPGDFDSSLTALEEEPRTKSKKGKKKKGKGVAGKDTPKQNDAGADPSDLSSPPSAEPPSKPTRQASSSNPQLSKSAISIDTDESWTRVEPRRHKVRPEKTTGAEGQLSADLTASDAGVTTSVTTGNSSPTNDRTEDEAASETTSAAGKKKTLAEKLLPKPRKTAVDDMLETPGYPELSRVMRIKPRADEQPATGFSWADYEDVRVEEGGGGGAENDADGEDDGWGVVQSRGRSKPNRNPSSQSQTQKAPETLTKRQRQNANKREAQKSAKADAEAERLAILSRHKKELEKAKMAEQFSGKGKGKSKTSGGMTAIVDDHGKLVWE